MATPEKQAMLTVSTALAGLFISRMAGLEPGLFLEITKEPKLIRRVMFCPVLPPSYRKHKK